MEEILNIFQPSAMVTSTGFLQNEMLIYSYTFKILNTGAPSKTKYIVQ